MFCSPSYDQWPFGNVLFDVPWSPIFDDVRELQLVTIYYEMVRKSAKIWPSRLKSLPVGIISGAPDIANHVGIPLERKELGGLSANGRLGFLETSARAGWGPNSANHGAFRGN